MKQSRALSQTGFDAGVNTGSGEWPVHSQDTSQASHQRITLRFLSSGQTVSVSSAVTVFKEIMESTVWFLGCTGQDSKPSELWPQG